VELIYKILDDDFPWDIYMANPIWWEDDATCLCIPEWAYDPQVGPGLCKRRTNSRVSLIPCVSLSKDWKWRWWRDCVLSFTIPFTIIRIPTVVISWFYLASQLPNDSISFDKNKTKEFETMESSSSDWYFMPLRPNGTYKCRACGSEDDNAGTCLSFVFTFKPPNSRVRKGVLNYPHWCYHRCV